MSLSKTPRRIAPGVFMVGGPDLTDPRDCLCYLVAAPGARVLIDCGAGPSAAAILDLAVTAGGDPPPICSSPTPTLTTLAARPRYAAAPGAAWSCTAATPKS